ncbi:MAG: hybrid sensor histidine kinase/response regulator [Bacteroidia bacterium]|nr:hybrid sensor histidine kinase/response regulator [Bacteroidia bacterium]
MPQGSCTLWGNHSKMSYKNLTSKPLMGQENDSFYRELLNDFKTESAEHYESIVQGIHELVPGEDDANFVSLETLYRNTHSLKGAARAISLKDIEKVCSVLENVFGKIKKKEVTLSPELIRELKLYASLIKDLIDGISGSKVVVPGSRISREIKNLEKVAFEQKLSSIKEEPSGIIIKEKENQKQYDCDSNKAHFSQIENASVRIPTEHLNKILQQTENFIAIKSTLSYYKSELEEISQRYNDTKVYELLRDISSFENVLSRMTNDLITSIRETLLSNFSNFFRLLDRMVKEIADEYNKEIIFKTIGSSAEIDRRILDELKDPIIHIIRNCIDHGIEDAPTRLSLGKPAKGTIFINVEKQIDQNVVITIDDDGFGIDREKIRNSAVKNGLFSESEASQLNDKQVDDLIFASGVTSKKFVTDLSGRGLGMSIVADKIARMDGTITTESTPGKSTRFTITLPQTIATFKGILVKCGKQQLMIPSKFVTSVKRIKKSEIINLGNGAMIRDGDGPSTGIVRLSEVMSIDSYRFTGKSDQILNVMFICRKNIRYAYIVDEIYEEYEGIIQNKGIFLGNTQNIAGVTMIKNGVVVPVVKVKELLRNSGSVTSLQREIINQEAPSTEVGKVLIAEDSITIRSMLRNIVESAGYEVTTAVDGKDAFGKLKTERFDIVVSDIEMPNMNGFELTRNIKEHPEYNEIPVILVTALESQSDMKKGMDAGADAYIVKSSFEKSNLVETIKRFL